MAVVKVFDEIMNWNNINELKDYLIRNNIKYEDIEIISYSE
jgi:hypothetical protein